MIRFYIPAFIGVVAGALYNIIDRIFIGHCVGSHALSGLSVTFPIMIIVQAFAMLVGIGSALLVSIELGRGNRERAEKILGNALFLLAALAIVLTAAGLALKKTVLGSFGATADTMEYADQFITIILAANIFGMTGNGMNSAIRAEGNAGKAMFSLILSVVINIVLDAFFIIKLGAGVRGAAAATAIAQAVLAVYVILHFTGNKSVIKLRLKNLAPDSEIIRSIISSGIAPFLMQMAASVIQTLYNKQLIIYGGDAAVAVMGIINSLAILIVMSIISLNMAAQPILGYNYGAGNYSRVKETYKLTLKYSTFISITAFIVTELFPARMIGVFSDDPALTAIGVTGLRIFMLMMPVCGIQIVTSNFFQATGRPRVAAAITLLRQVVFLIPLLLVLPGIFGINGVWISSSASDGINAVFVAVLIFYAMKDLDKKISITAPAESRG